MSSRDKCYYLTLPLDYLAWARGGWADRVWLAHAALSERLKKLPIKHFNKTDRDALATAVDQAAWAAATSPPRRVELLGIAQRLPGGSIAYDQSALALEGVVPITLKEIETYVASPPEPPQARGFKRYRRHDSQLLFWEAWIEGAGVVEHRGVCGLPGSTERLQGHDQQVLLNERCKLAEASDFRRIPLSAHKGVQVHLQASNDDARALLDRRHALEDWLNELLGWRGLGECDGGETDGVIATAFCLVVDSRLGRSVIIEELAGSPFSDARVTV